MNYDQQSAFDVLLLAAARGPQDPMAQAFKVSHKCLIPIAGIPMLQRVLDTLASHPQINQITIAIDAPEIAAPFVTPLGAKANIILAAESASASVAQHLPDTKYPLLITTADHPVLDHAMLDEFFAASLASNADLTVALAEKAAIEARFPQSKRTFLRLGSDHVSGCNLFALLNKDADKAITFWRDIERHRKNPVKLIAAFGTMALLRYLTGFITLDSAFKLASKRLKINARPVIISNPEAAVDVDKPEHKPMAEEILRHRAV